MNYVTENITPQKALEYLKTSQGNRPISKPTVLSYADTMKQGKWLLNGCSINFDINGNLLDGHHRLHAVIEANIPVKFDVCRGVPTESFATYDCGRHRTLGQLLAMQNTKHYNLAASIVMVNEVLCKTGRVYTNNSNVAGDSKKRLSNAEKYELYRKDPDGFNAVSLIIVRLQSRCRILSGSWAGGLYYFLTHKGGYREDEVLPFFEQLFSLSAAENQSIEQLRQLITRYAFSSSTKLSTEALWAYIVKTWNRYITNTPKKDLKFSPSSENMPTLILREQDI